MKISVYITSYNQKDYLKTAIDSVLAQTLRPHEIIVIDDCSTDGSQELISEYVRKFPDIIKPIFHQVNTGVTQSRIDALAAVTGHYVSYLDGDDRYFPTKLEKEAALIKDNPGVQLVFSNFYFFNEKLNRQQVWIKNTLPPTGHIFKDVFSRNFPNQTLFRNELVDYNAWKDIGFHDPAINLYEDFEVKIRLTKRLKAAYQPEPLVEYRLHDKGLSRSKKERHLEALNYVYSKNMPLLDDLNPAEKKTVLKRVYYYLGTFTSLLLISTLKDFITGKASFSSLTGSIKRYFQRPGNCIVTIKMIIFKIKRIIIRNL